MQYTVRAAVAAAIAAAVGLGLTAPAASAAPKEKPAHVKTVKDAPRAKAGAGVQGTKAKGPKSAKAQKGAMTGAEVRTARFVRNVTAQVNRIQTKVEANHGRVVGNTAAAVANEAAATAVKAAQVAIAAVTTGTKDERRAVRVELLTARRALAAVEIALDAPVIEEPTNEEPVLEEPLGGEPILDEPVSEEPVAEELEPVA